MKYKSFNKLKYKQTHEKYRPSYIQITKSDSDYFKEKNKYGTSSTNHTRPKDTKNFPIHSGMQIMLDIL